MLIINIHQIFILISIEYMQEKQVKYFEFRVGNIQKSTATLVDLDYNLMELPVYLLPEGTKPGSVIKMTLAKDDE